MKISNPKHVPKVENNSQKNINLVHNLSPRDQKDTQNIKILSSSSEKKLLHQRSERFLQIKADNQALNNKNLLPNQQSPRILSQQFRQTNIIRRAQQIVVQGKQEILMNKNSINGKNEYHYFASPQETNHYNPKNNINNVNLQNLKINNLPQNHKIGYVQQSVAYNTQANIPLLKATYNNTNNFITDPPQPNNNYPQQKIIQSYSVQKEKKHFLNTLHQKKENLLQKSKSNHNLNHQNTDTLLNSQNKQVTSAQRFQKNSKHKTLNLNPKKKQNQETQEELKNLQSINLANQYYNVQSQHRLQPFGSQNRKKRHNFLRLSKSLDHNQINQAKIHLHTSKIGNKVDFDKMYDEEDFGSKNSNPNPKMDLNLQQSGKLQNQRNTLTIMESELKHNNKQQKSLKKNGQIKFEQNNKNLQNPTLTVKNVVETQPILKLRSNEAIKNNFHQNMVYQDQYMIQTRNMGNKPQIAFNKNPILNTNASPQVQTQPLIYSPQINQNSKFNKVVNFQVKNPVNHSQQITIQKNSLNFISINPQNNVIISQQQTNQNSRPKSSIPKIQTTNKIKNSNQLSYQMEQAPTLDLQSNFQNQKHFIVQNHQNEKNQRHPTETQNLPKANPTSEEDKSGIKFDHSPSFGGNNPSHNSFLNLNSNLKSKNSLQKHLQQDNLLPEKKEQTNSICSIMNNYQNQKITQIQQTQTYDNLSRFHIRKDETKKTLLSRAESHGLSDLIMGVKQINVTHNSLKSNQNSGNGKSVKGIQRSQSEGLSDLILGVKQIDINNKSLKNSTDSNSMKRLFKSQNLIERANSNRSQDATKGINKLNQMNDVLPLDSKPSSPQIGLNTTKVLEENSNTINKVTDKKSVQSQYENLNSNITTLQNLTHKQTDKSPIHQSKIVQKPQISSYNDFSNLKLNSNSKLTNNFNYNNHSGSNLKPISEMQSQWEKQSSLQEKSQSKQGPFQEINSQKTNLSSHRNIQNQKFTNFDSIMAKSPNNVRKMNSLSNDITSLNEIGSGLSQETGLSNMPSLLEKQNMEKNLISNEKILSQLESSMGDQFLKLNTKVFQSKGMMKIAQQVLNNQNRPLQQVAQTQQWLNINREKYSTSEYLNAEQMKNRTINVEKLQTIKDKQQFKDQHRSQQNLHVKDNKLSNLQIIQKQHDDFRQKINSISQTLLSITNIALSQQGSSPSRNSPQINKNSPYIIKKKSSIIEKNNVAQNNPKRYLIQKMNPFEFDQRSVNQDKQIFQKTTEYFYPPNNNKNQQDQHVQYEYSQDGSHANQSLQNRKQSLLLNSNLDYFQNQDLSDTKKKIYISNKVGKRKSYSKMKNKNSSKLNSSISNSSIHSLQSKNSKEANLYTKRHNHSEENDNKNLSNIKSSSQQVKNQSIYQQTKRDHKLNIMFSNSVFSSQQENYHKLPKPSIYEPQMINQLQVFEIKNSQKSFKSRKIIETDNLNVKNQGQSQGMLDLSSANSLSFNFASGSNQPSKKSLKQNSLIESQKQLQFSQQIQREQDKMQGSKSKVQTYVIIQKQTQTNNLYKPIPSIKKIKPNQNSITPSNPFQPMNYVQDTNTGLNNSLYSSKHNRQLGSEYGISEDSVNYVPITRPNNISQSLGNSSSQFLPKQSQQNFSIIAKQSNQNQSSFSTILDQKYVPENYYESKYQISSTSQQVRYAERPNWNQEETIYGKESNVIEAINFNSLSQ